MSAGLHVDNPSGVSTVVTITYVGGGAVTVYSDAACTSSVSMPATITADGDFFVAQSGPYDVSVVAGGVAVVAPQFLPSGSRTATVAPAVAHVDAATVDKKAAQAVGTSLASPTTGDAGKFVAVKEDETGYELVDAPSGGGAGPVTMAVYEASTLAGSLAANTTFQHDLDATPTGTPGTGNVTVNADGVYTAILHAELYGSGITGGYVLLTAHLSGQTLSVDAEGAPDPGDGEYDTTLTLGPIPMSADDNFSVQISQHGGTPDGNARLIVTKTG